ncbi:MULTISPECIES: glycosyltransferase family 2 protein [Sphingobacterium]|uniref:glycosyltransferase family 2 protein n=1 Tax=Sphingobacterium TaxID=28453 RepID=UPI00257E4D47|nr:MULTISPECIES: glycosyltransferase family 2 protein [Sphingobacterium]
MLITILWYIDFLFFFAFTLWVCYVALFAFASRIRRKIIFPDSVTSLRFAILFPAYKEDNVIRESVSRFKAQNYPIDKFEIVVISDAMEDRTNDQLRAMGISLIHPDEGQRSKAAALTAAMSRLDTQLFDVVVVMDADNIVFPDFLSKLNNAFASGAKAIQTHRTAKNNTTATAILDGVSEEINNSIFRLGHARLGLPAALIGSGMAFDFNWFKQRIAAIKSMGEDKFLEYFLLLDRINTIYLEDVVILDEKIQYSEDFSKQRRRWIASQIDIFCLAIKQTRHALVSGNWALIDKIFQWSMPPRIIMLGIIPLFLLISFFVVDISSLKWFFLITLYMMSLALAIPKKMYTKQLFLAIFTLPRIFLAMVSSIIHFRSGRSTFIHTKHGTAPSKED